MITVDTLKDSIAELGIHPSRILCFDQEYVMPTRHWVTEDLGKAMKNFLDKNKIYYRDNQFECNKYAKIASSLADIAFFKTLNVDEALAFGIFGYVKQDGAGHMINIAAHREYDKSITIGFYEPQPMLRSGLFANFTCLNELKLTPAEIKSCVDCIFL